MLIDSKFRSETVGRDRRASAEFIASANPSATTFYPENAVIYGQGDDAGPLYLVEFGVVRTCRVTADGRRQISGFHFAGEVFGFEVGQTHEFYAESVNGAGVRTLRSNDQSLAPNLLEIALSSLVIAQQHQLVLGRRNAVEKVAGFILDMIERQDADNVVGLPMQRNDIADYLGLTLETVSRALRSLKDEAVIRLPTAHQIEVKDRDALELMVA
jgi:CRP/FNR family nitrogen fixation transcriptional regulator